MRPCPEEEAGGLPAAAPVVAAARDEDSDDFLRGGNPLSVAAEKYPQGRLEVEVEVCFDEFFSCRVRVIPEDKVVFRGLIAGWWETRVHFLRVRILR